jgi:hypothetical protein
VSIFTSYHVDASQVEKFIIFWSMYLLYCLDDFVGSSPAEPSSRLD